MTPTRFLLSFACALAALAWGAAPAGATVGWSQAPPMGIGRAQESEVTLPDGEVLVAGGFNGFVEGVGGHPVAQAGAELFDPATRSWRPAAPMHVGRFGQTTTLLADGRVLVVGGQHPGSGGEGLQTAEIYDPVAETWTQTSQPPELQLADTATLLPGGDVLVTGLLGPREYGARPGALEFSPATDTWATLPPPPSGAERERTAVALPGGEVLLAGGVSYEEVEPPGHGVENRQIVYAAAETFDPATAMWTPVAPMHVARIGPTATLLPSGLAFLTGGLTEISGGGSEMSLASTESYDPTTDTWTPGPPMRFARGRDSASLLHGGDVLVTGGTPCNPSGCVGYGAPSGCCAAETAEIYDPGAGAWTSTEPILTLAEHGAAVLPDGSVLVSGGNYDFGNLHETAAAEIYGDLPPPAEQTTAALTKLRLRGLRQSHRRWREPGMRAPQKRKGARPLPVGTLFSFHLSEAATVTLEFRSARHPHRSAAKIELAGRAGENRLRFTGTLKRGGRLGPGSYTLSATAVRPGSTTPPATTSRRHFTIAASPHRSS